MCRQSTCCSKHLFGQVAYIVIGNDKKQRLGVRFCSYFDAPRRLPAWKVSLWSEDRFAMVVECIKDPVIKPTSYSDIPTAIRTSTGGCMFSGCCIHAFLMGSDLTLPYATEESK